jgi:hypothetical protein
MQVGNDGPSGGIGRGQVDIKQLSEEHGVSTSIYVLRVGESGGIEKGFKLLAEPGHPWPVHLGPRECVQLDRGHITLKSTYQVV